MVAISTEDALRYRKLARQCGTWAAARKMAKDGYAVETAAQVLAAYAWWLR